jgi:hypothetical protein
MQAGNGRCAKSNGSGGGDGQKVSPAKGFIRLLLFVFHKEEVLTYHEK